MPRTPNCDIFEQSLITSSPPDPAALYSSNQALKQVLETQETLHTPVRHYISRLSNMTEKLRAHLTIAEETKNQLESVLSARKERASGKRLVLKGQFIVSRADIQKAIAEAEATTEAKKKKKRDKQERKEAVVERNIVMDDSNAEDDETLMDIQDCIVIESRL